VSTVPTLTIVFSPDEITGTVDTSFLRQGVAPLPPPPTPSDANAQDILFVVDDESEIVLTFDITDPDLASRVALECDSVYALIGTQAGTQRFLAALYGYGVGPPGSQQERQLLARQGQLRGEPWYQDPQRTPKRDALVKACEKRLDELKSFAKAVVDKFQPAAQKQADREIQRSVDDLFHEAARYFGDGAFAPSPEQPSDSPPALVREDAALAGKDLGGLAEAFAQINEAVTAVDKAQAAYSAKWPPGTPSGGTPLPSERQQQQLAQQDLQVKKDTLSTTIIEACRVYPILYRLWSTPITGIVATIWNQTPQTSQLEALKNNETLRVWLIDLINKSSRAAQDFQASFRQDATLVWKYDRVIYATLNTLGLTRGDVAYRAVEEMLWETRASHEAWTSLLSNVSACAQNLDLLAGLLGIGAPPVALLATALFGVETIVKIVAESEKDAAFNACLDPGKSLVVEQGSLGSAVIDGLFLLLALAGAPKQISSLFKAVP
jgi:hypothetical protein